MNLFELLDLLEFLYLFHLHLLQWFTLLSARSICKSISVQVNRTPVGILLVGMLETPQGKDRNTSLDEFCMNLLPFFE